MESISTLRRAVALAPNSEVVWDQLGYVYAYWTGGIAFIHSLLGGRDNKHSPGCGGLWKLGITIIRGFRKTSTTTAYVVIPNTSASWKKCGSTGNNTNRCLEFRNVR
jgi:hypothetical protein